MLKYIVLFIFQDPLKCLPIVVEKLHSMEGVIPELLSMETAADLWHNLCSSVGWENGYL